jgi:quinol-cytochrome oxidoreductase complex cytochrome b subunit
VYSAVLTIHSWLRWVALLLGVAATLNAFRVRDDETMPPKGGRWDWWFMLAVDIQVLLGLLLYFGLSPFTRDAMSNVGVAMRNPQLRFFLVTHVAAMVVAIAAVRAGRVLATGDQTSSGRRTGRCICFGIALLVMAAGVPWPGLIYGRPLFRW